MLQTFKFSLKMQFSSCIIHPSSNYPERYETYLVNSVLRESPVYYRYAYISDPYTSPVHIFDWFFCFQCIILNPRFINKSLMKLLWIQFKCTQSLLIYSETDLTHFHSVIPDCNSVNFVDYFLKNHLFWATGMLSITSEPCHAMEQSSYNILWAFLQFPWLFFL